MLVVSISPITNTNNKAGATKPTTETKLANWPDDVKYTGRRNGDSTFSKTIATKGLKQFSNVNVSHCQAGNFPQSDNNTSKMVLITLAIITIDMRRQPCINKKLNAIPYPNAKPIEGACIGSEITTLDNDKSAIIAHHIIQYTCENFIELTFGLSVLFIFFSIISILSLERIIKSFRIESYFSQKTNNYD